MVKGIAVGLSYGPVHEKLKAGNVVDALVTAYDTRVCYMKRKDDLTTGAVLYIAARTFGIVIAKS